MQQRLLFAVAGLAATLAAGAERAPTGGLPDTGQTTRYTKSFGEDSDFTGSSPAYQDNKDGTVTDLVTGLVWQRVDGGEMTWEKAKEYAKSLRLAGKQDWRLPNSNELLSLMNHGLHGPAMDTTVFPHLEARYWWTGTAKVDDPSKVWLVNTGGGIGAHAKTETISAGGDRPVHIRCVRGTSRLGSGPTLKDNGDGTVTDQRTGLVWQKVGPARRGTWEEALRACSELDLAGRKDWRLPNIKELRSLSDDALAAPSADRKFLPGMNAAAYWSSTTQCNRPERAWFTDFTSGLVTYADKTTPQWFLAVRGGEPTAGSREKTEPDPKTLAPPEKAKGGGKGKPKGDKKGGN